MSEFFQTNILPDSIYCCLKDKQTRAMAAFTSALLIFLDLVVLFLPIIFYNFDLWIFLPSDNFYCILKIIIQEQSEFWRFYAI